MLRLFVLLIYDGRPFIIDLESTNGTLVNDEKIPESRYYELKASDGSDYSCLPSTHN